MLNNQMAFDTLMKDGQISMPTTDNNGIAVPFMQNMGVQPQIYTTNRSVDIGLLTTIINQILPFADMSKQADSRERFDMNIGIISFVLTQVVPMFVRHDGFLYIYNGKIYSKIITPEETYPMIREICENAARIISGLECSAYITARIFSEISQKAIHIKYPDDIHNLIVFNNGILNLATMQLEPFQVGRFITNMVTTDWTGQCECPYFESLLDVYTQGDNILKERMVEALGVCLTNDIVKKIICFLGVSHSGKSFLVNFLLSLINDEAVHILQPNDFERQFATSQIHEKAIIACMDMEAAPLNARATATLKSILGHDRINFELKHANGGHTFLSRAHIILCSNYAVTTQKEDAAFEMRKLVVPFDHRLDTEAIPPEVLMNTLEVEKSAVAGRLISAYMKLRNRNYEFSGGISYNSYIPMNGMPLTREQSFYMFQSNCLVMDIDSVAFTADLYQAYCRFAEENNGFVFSGYNAFAKYAANRLQQFEHTRKYRENNMSGNAESCFVGIKII